ncbi:DNA-3-methyladenine glycosylase family protein [Rhodospirillaceae bacterium SYSU D60014]|uniref:DNA-3-methyladenine glycosylase family protein n=1 Tax=Virgifigura deserti TaxID=2268457 RepID=UPI000E67578B
MAAGEFKGKRLQRALDELAAADADFARTIPLVGALPSRARTAGFGSLLNIIVAQQVSTASARAIWARLEAATDPLTPDRFLALDEPALKAIGLSRQKMAYGRALAADLVEGRLDLDALADLTDEEAIAALVKAKGVGRWTAEVYLLFCLNRPDVLPADDLALLIAAQRLKGLAARPSAAQFRVLAEPWRPWRSIAARLLWQLYRQPPLEAG